MPHRDTIQARVAEAATEVERKARHDSHFKEDADREAIYDKATDPNSNWPEPALTSDNLKQQMEGWMPAETPSTRSAKQTTVQHPHADRGDSVEGINRDVGHGLTHIDDHGSKKMAGGHGRSLLDAQ